MNVSAWSIKKPIPTIVLFLILTIVGWFCFNTLGIDISPNIDIPTVQVTVTRSGAGPTELESQVTKKIEDAVAGLGNIDELRSVVTDGVSNTIINFDLGTDSDRATNDVRNAIAQIRQSLPQDIDDPIVQLLEFSGSAVMTYVVSSDKQSVEELSNVVDETISRALLSVKGVAEIRRIGGVNREIRVNLDPDRLQSLGITATQVNDQLRAFNINLPGGRAEIGGSEQSIRTLGSAQSVDVLRNYEIILPNGGSVPLSTLGKVDDSFGEVRKIARLNNKPVVAFEVLRSTGSVMVTVEEGIRKEVEKLEKILPQDVKMQLIFTRATFVRNSYQSTMNELLTASVLAVVVILLFLRDWRATLITAITLPLSIIPTFGVMFALGYTLNNMTLLGLGLAVGNLVDDAVVEIENMERHLGMGKEPKQAAFDSSAEMGLAVIATSATIVAVFLPVAFMGGIPGQFFQPFAMTVTAATVFSTAVARMVTPMMGAYLLKKKVEGQRPEVKGQRSKVKGEDTGINNLKSKIQNPKFSPYASTLRWALRHRVTTLLLALAFFIGSLMLVPMIPKGLVDGADVGISGVTIELAPGSTLEDTKKVVTQATNLITQNPAVDSVLSTENVGSASLTVRLKPKEERGISQSEFEEKVRPQFDQIPGARISFQSTGAVGGGKDLTIVLQSENPQALKKAADDLEKDMRTVPGLVEASSTASLVKPEILIVPDPQRAADLGVTVQSIARTAVLATIGDGDANLAKYNLPDRQIPIRVQI
ncbi:MAG: efflux RND transporter permease subunit, partial [Cyanobacteria bacterium P01_D01_bin.116]